MKPQMFRDVLLGSFLALQLTAVAGPAREITFDDISTASEWAPLTNGYAGLVWTNFGAINGLARPASEGYHNGVISVSNVAFNVEGGSATVLVGGGARFDFQSAYLTAHAIEGLQVQVRGFAGQLIVYSNSYTLSITNPLLAQFNFSNVDKVTFTPAVHSGFFAMDNLKVVMEPVVSIRGGANISENGSASIVVARSHLFDDTNDFTVGYTISGTASNGIDYVELPGSVTIPAGEHNLSFLITAIDDALVENTEGVTLKLQSNPNYKLSSMSNVTVNILDNDSTVKPTLTVFATDDSGIESNGEGEVTGQFMVKRSGAPIANPLTVQFTLGGTAENGVDYSNILTTVVIPAGMSNGFVTVEPIDDALIEGTETVMLTLTSNAHYSVGEISNATVSILDNDANVNARPVTEWISPTNGTTYGGPVVTYLKVTASDSDGTVDRVQFYRGNVLLGIATNAIDSGRYEWQTSILETSTFKAIAFDNLGAVATSGPVTIYINSPVKPAITITATDNSATEGENGGTGKFMVKRTGAPITNSLTVALTISGTASNGHDYTAIPASVVIPAGLSNAFVTVTPINDSIIEALETVVLTVKSNSAYSIGSPNTATVSIEDNDTPQPTLTVIVTDDSAAEADGTGEFMIKRAGAPIGNPLTVHYNLTGTAENGVDFVNVATSVIIPAGMSNGFVQIAPIDDALNEGVESVVLTLSSNANYKLGQPREAMIAIGDNDEITNHPPVVTWIAPTNGTVLNSTSVTLKAAASDEDGQIQRVEFYRGDDLLGISTNGNPNMVYTFHWALNNTSPVTAVLTAKAIDNSGAATTTAPVTITINPPVNKPTVTLLVTDNSAAEGDGSATGRIRITRSGSTDNELKVYYGLSGTASNSVDYTYTYPWVVIPPGASNIFITINPIDDLLVEATETVNVKLNTNANYNIGTPSNGTINLLDNDLPASNTPPTVTIVLPTNGAKFPAFTNISIYAQTYDAPTGWVDRVEFFANSNSLGIVTNCRICAIVGPTHFSWLNVQPGQYVLRAKATDNEGASTMSQPVEIVVQPPPPGSPTVVSVVALDSVAGEGPEGTDAYHVGVFQFRRENNTNTSLTVYYDLSGTASEGLDYLPLRDTVTFLPGVSATNLVVRPVDDKLVEGIETVKVTLPPIACIAVYPSPDCYEVGHLDRATVSINDNDVITNLPPTVLLTAPTNQAVYYGSTNIRVSAEASDSDGPVKKVDFFAGEQLLGVDSNAPYSLIWSNVAIGSYTIKARATDDANAVRWSAPVSISVRHPAEISFVRRQLPLWYVPGSRLLVTLRAEPKTNATSYVVEDRPPANWVVGEISAGGVYAFSDGKVRFSFPDGEARTLTYEVTPPLDALGEKQFIGSAIQENVVSPILGVSTIRHAPAHPADRNPTNFFMSSLEVSNYVAAWKRCERWPTGPNPIPVNYVSRAGYLLVNGGSYVISPLSPTPVAPLLWVATNRYEISPFDPVGANYLSPASSGPALWITNQSGAAISAMPSNYFVGVPFTVSITVTPAEGVSAYAVEERPPLGWTVTAVSDHGNFCPVTGKVRWGAFLDRASRILTYTVTPTSFNAPSAAFFHGVASFDGVNTPITGIRRVTRLTVETSNVTVQPVKVLADGNRLFSLDGDVGTCYRIEGSTNLIDWLPIDELLNNDGSIQYIDLSTNQVQRFYRAIPR